MTTPTERSAHLSYDHAALRALYDGLGLRGIGALSSRRWTDDPLPVAGCARWGISAVLRPPQWTNALQGCARDVARATGPRGVVYGVHNLHVTIQQLDGYRDAIAADDPSLLAQRRVLAAFAASTPPLTLSFRGVTASTGGVLLQGWPSFDLQALRARLHHALAAAGIPVAGPEASSSALRTSAHATLSIHGNAIVAPDDLARFVTDHRETPWQTTVFDALWLVGYARTATSVTLIEYGRFPFGAPAGSSR